LNGYLASTLVGVAIGGGFLLLPKMEEYRKTSRKIRYA